MNADNYGLIEIGFTAAVVLGLAFWQLRSVNREIAKDRAARSAERARHPVGEHRADDA